ncbi:hypothetical protein BG011_009703 [Mortierella polycephala]|uniref:Uncharacterized protein n=1 Tax=Mortierella polycephala TaxID=41804 RepID=A0A9P6QCT4_9FUNG|nr:hypothetical protein BG011_009703 [Mortierella polycephala]
MHNGYFNNWPPPATTLIDTLGDLHQSRTTSPASTPISTNAPSLPTSATTIIPNAAQPHSTSIPSNRQADDSSNGLPKGTDKVTTAPPAALAPRPPRSFPINSINNTDPPVLRNTLAEGFFGTPFPIPVTGYAAASSAATTQKDHVSTVRPIKAHRTNPSFMSDLASKSYATASTQFVVPPPVIRSSSGYSGFSSTSSNGKSKKQPPSERARPMYHPFAGMDLGPSSRSYSYAGTPNSLRLAGLTGASLDISMPAPSANLRKSLSVSKPAKKGIKSRLRRLRQKQGSSSRETSANTFITSGESDSEAAFDADPDAVFNSGGITYRFTPPTTSSSKSSFKRPKFPRNNISLPLPPRGNSHHVCNSACNHNNGKQSTSGGEYGSSENHKEPSSVRFKDFFKNVGLSNQHYIGHTTVSPAASDHNDTNKGIQRPLQTRGTFPLFGDFLSGDDQPSTSTTRFRLAGPGRRKRRFTKKSHSAATRMMVPFTSAAATDDEDSPASRSGPHHQEPPLQRNHYSSHHTFLHHLQRRHRSRSIGEDVPRDFDITWKPESRISASLKEARCANPDPNVLLVELEPLPAKFLSEFASLSTSKGPLSTYITPSSTANSGQGPMNSAPTTFSHYHQRSGSKCADILCTKTFLFKSYQNSKFQGHYIFRVVGQHIEYKKLPVALEQPCSQYFREAYVTYRLLEKKAKTLREERERSRQHHYRAKSREFEDHHDMSEPSMTTLPMVNKSQGSKPNSGGEILRSSVAWDQMRLGDEGMSSDSPPPTPGISFGRSTGYQEQRYNPESSNNALVQSIVGGINTRERNNLYSDTMSLKPPPHRSQLYHSRKRSWTSIREQQRLEQEQQRAIEDARWNKMEQKYREEFQQAAYGLESSLNEIINGSEYERFDATADVTIPNENRDTAVFTIINGDKTNDMWLEAPSAKLKYEFLNWIAISTMDHGELDSEVSKAPSSTVHRVSSLDAFMGSHKDLVDDDAEDTDVLFELIDIRLAQQEEKLQMLREEIQGTMGQIDDCLTNLEHLDENAKKLMTTMIRGIESQEIQLALRPSPTTGQTLAETVEWKLKDVHERIVICTKIMGQARYNLNRLRYEIELEQRSIRLFRQYKIIIGVVSFSIVLLVWFLYHSRANALAPQPASPLFPSPVNPFEKDYTFHHGEPLAMSSPVPTSSFNSDGAASAATMIAVINRLGRKQNRAAWMDKELPIIEYVDGLELRDDHAQSTQHFAKQATQTTTIPTTTTTTTDMQCLAPQGALWYPSKSTHFYQGQVADQGQMTCSTTTTSSHSTYSKKYN